MLLIVFEMANNHQGDVVRAKKIIDEFRAVANGFPEFEYAFKFQYRDLPTYIHPESDPNDKYVKRFRDTNIDSRGRKAIKDHAHQLGFITACTPFDEESVREVVSHGYDILKIGSPSFNDMDLIYEITGLWGGPVIASCGGATEQQIEKVERMFYCKLLTLMHCVSMYPTSAVDSNVARVGWLKRKYPDIRIGYSTHERHDSTRLPAALAMALGAEVFEKHVCIEPRPNEYSVTPREMAHWLHRMRDAVRILGQENYIHREVEQEQLARFSRKKIDGKMWWKP